MIRVGQRTSFPTCQQAHLPMGVVQLLSLQGWVANFSNISILKPPRSALQDFEVSKFGPPYNGVIEPETNLKAQFFPTLLSWCMPPLWPKLTKKWRNSKLQCLYLRVSSSNRCVHKYVFQSGTSMILHRSERCANIGAAGKKARRKKHIKKIIESLKVGHCCPVSASNCASLS